jgi:hypothetical protein
MNHTAHKQITCPPYCDFSVRRSISIEKYSSLHTGRGNMPFIVQIRLRSEWFEYLYFISLKNLIIWESTFTYYFKSCQPSIFLSFIKNFVLKGQLNSAQWQRLGKNEVIPPIVRDQIPFKESTLLSDETD